MLYILPIENNVLLNLLSVNAKICILYLLIRHFLCHADSVITIYDLNSYYSCIDDGGQSRQWFKDRLTEIMRSSVDDISA
jgi:hypothetical protein